MSLLDVQNLTIHYADAAKPAVQDLGFALERGDALGIVGESGSGKTQTAIALMGLLPANAKTSGSIRFDGIELLGAPAKLLNQYRARRIAMVFQDPMAALNPYVRIGDQLRRVLLEHKICNPAEARSRTLEMLCRVGLPDPERQFAAFPHQLSGGMRQRAMIGAALLGEPDLLVADEPTTALDVTVQAQILSLLRELRADANISLLLISHDLGVIAGNCERMMVMNNGQLVEEGKTRDVFSTPKSDLTKALLAASPRITDECLARTETPTNAPVVSVEDMVVSFRERRARGRSRLKAVRGISFSLQKGETVAVVGESGSGKTSLARALIGLIPADNGRVCFLGEYLPARVQNRNHKTRRELQMVFQDPLASLNPTMLIGDIVAEPIRVHEAAMDKRSRADAVKEILVQVGLGEQMYARYPHELSGGQAQRVAIARALILKPTVLICDEAVAALDGTVQNDILSLLQAEQQRSGLSLIFITHDLAVVRRISHRVLIMYMGRLCELSENAALFNQPRHPYTKALLNAVLPPEPGASAVDAPLAGEVSSILTPPEGCPFHPRCPHAIGVCSETIPTPADLNGGTVACHRASELDLSY